MSGTPAALPPANTDGAGPSSAPGTSAQKPGIDTNKHPSGIVPQLQNVVATLNFGCLLDLKTIAMHARNAEYNPKRFAACIVRIKDPKTTALIFASGKMVCTGAKSEESARLAARKYTKILQKLNFDVHFSDFTIQNMVASCSTEFPIRLEGVAAIHEHFAHYEPEVFPGLVYRMRSPKIVLLIFVTGKIVLTGAKSVDQIYEAFEKMYPVLIDFRKGDARQVRALTAPTPAAAPTPRAMPPPATPQLENGAVPRAPTLAQEAAVVPAETPYHGFIPPPTPLESNIPPPSPMVHIPPPTPGVSRIPPPSPALGRIPPPSPYPGSLSAIPPPSPYPTR